MRKRSLKFDLLFDLSLLAVCAVVIMEALVVLYLRQAIPAEWGNLARTTLQSVHARFIRERGPFVKNPEPQIIQATFLEFVSSENWTHVNLRIEEIPSQKEKLSIITKRYLLVPSVLSYELSVPFNNTYTFHYTWSLEPFHRHLDLLKWKILPLGIILVLFLIMFGYFILFKRNVLRPIDLLSQLASQFKGGNFNSRLTVTREDEIGRIGSALNDMADMIQEKEKKIVNTIESLKRANEEIELAQQEQLQIEKLASVGRLAAGVAHEVGNPLGAISGYIDILRRALKTHSAVNPEDLELCDRIEVETNRISKIVRALLQQARPVKERIKAVSIQRVLSRSSQLSQVPPSISLDVVLEDQSAEVHAEEDQLVQVFVNLIMNAVHAIQAKKMNEEKGRILLRCVKRKLPVYRSGSESIDLDISVVRALKPQTYWVVSVEDNGIGIDENDQKKLFEPFFSTKEPGKGTGLGLYVSKSIVEGFRGAVVVRSSKGYGTAFSVFLPMSGSDFVDA